MPADDKHQPDVAEDGKALLLDPAMNEPPSSTTCPECGGSLWERRDDKVLRYQCHVGHSYTIETLMSEKGEQLEAILWTALRALEENANLRHRMARRAEKGPSSLRELARKYEKQAQEAEDRAAVLREVLTNGKSTQKLARKTTAQRTAKSVRSQSVKRTHKGNGKTKRRTNGRSLKHHQSLR
jgi:two-component system chemotaxis response regulator CheB